MKKLTFKVTMKSNIDH